MKRLFDAKIIAAPDAGGKALAINPFLEKFAANNATAAFQPIADKSKAAEKVRKFLTEDHQDSEPVNQNASEENDDAISENPDPSPSEIDETED